jgi:hypothetical protein
MYNPEQSPREYDPDWLDRELNNIKRSLLLFDFIQLKELHVEPTKPRDGMVVFADGTDWDPGSGQGYYGYYGAVWNFLG